MWHCIALVIMLCLWPGCGKEKPQPKPSARESSAFRESYIKAFFNSPLKNRDNFNGFWSVDPHEFAEYIENMYLKDYTPWPNELPPEQVRANIKNSRYFLRIDGDFCDELFVIANGHFSVSAGTMKKLERANDRTAYSVIFSRGNRDTRGAVLSTFHKQRHLVLEFPEYKLKFHRESESPAVLAERYGKIQ